MAACHRDSCWHTQGNVNTHSTTVLRYMAPPLPNSLLHCPLDVAGEPAVVVHPLGQLKQAIAARSVTFTYSSLSHAT